MNQYRKKTYYRKRNYNNSNRNTRRFKDTFHQPMPENQMTTPYSRHTLTKGDVEAVVEAMLSGTLTQGKELERFESLLAKLTHCHYALAVNSGTAAIHTALAAIGLQPEDEVIMSTLNFCAVANMVKLMGAKPVLVDCDPETLTISVEEAKKAVTEKTKAIFANNFAGHASDMFALREICNEHELFLLEDACHGLGGRYRGHYTGNQADLTCFSFHPSKAITTGEGGAVTTNDVDKFAFMKQFRHHGIQKDPDYFKMESFNADYHQELQFQGMNYRMNELQAALGRNQLTRLDRHIERRRAIAQVYHNELSGQDCLILPQCADWADHAYHLFPIQLTGSMFGKRDQVFSDFKSSGIEVQVHYRPIHMMPFYADEYKDGSFPNAESYFANCISIPVFPDMSIKDIDKVVDRLKKAIEAYRTGQDQEEEVVGESQKQDESAVVESVQEAAAAEAPAKVEEEKKTSPYRRRGRKKLSTAVAKEDETPAESGKEDTSASDKNKISADSKESTEPVEEKAEESTKETEKPKTRGRRKTAPRKTTKTAKEKNEATQEEPVKEKEVEAKETETPAKKTTRGRKKTTTTTRAKTKKAADSEKSSEKDEKEKPVKRKAPARKRTTTKTKKAESDKPEKTSE